MTVLSWHSVKISFLVKLVSAKTTFNGNGLYLKCFPIAVNFPVLCVWAAVSKDNTVTRLTLSKPGDKIILSDDN